MPTELLVAAYAQGYFPMPDEETGELLWFRPEPRAILPLDGFHVSRSLERVLKKNRFRISRDEAFAAVMEGCADRQEGTWIWDDFFTSYGRLFYEGFAHSLEVWEGTELVGGVYGVTLGGAFFAESMFHTRDNTSKVALYHLVEHLKANDFRLLEVQFMTPHLKSLGAIEVSDMEYQKLLSGALQKRARFE